MTTPSQTIYAPNISFVHPEHPTVFLAGSIEMGNCDNWQEKVIAEFPTGITFFNPRRTDWDSAWIQSIDNEQFSEQVNWELDHLNGADIKFFYFDPATKAPITLLELGNQVAQHDVYVTCKLVVVCPDGYWRKGNVDILCERSNIHVYDSLEDGMIALRYLASN